MDEFGVLTEPFGLKRQGKSAPMAASKGPTSSSNVQSPNFGFDSGLNPKSSSYSSRSSPHSSNISQNFGGFDDYSDLLVGGPSKSRKQSTNSFDYDSIFSNNSTARPSSIYDNDDIFGGMPGLKSSVSVKNDDVFASFATPPKHSAPIEDLLGNLGGREANSKSSSRNGSVHSESNFDDLIPGFGRSSSPYNGNTTNQPQQAPFHSIISSKDPFVEDPFAVLESISKPAYTYSDVFSDPLEQVRKLNNSGGKILGASSNAIPPLRPPPKPTQVPKAEKVKSSRVSSIDELEDFAMGRVRNKAGERSHVCTSERMAKPSATKSSRYNEAEDASLSNLQNGGDDLESFFSVGPRSNSVPRSRTTTFDSAFDAPVHKGGSEVPQRVPSEASASIKKSPSVTFIVDDLSSIFGAAPLFGEFLEVEGETEERRRARWERHQRTQKRAAQAVADMNQRDLQTQQEQEERHRIAETVDVAIKRWAAGREGNMRALLSSLQNVLGPECGWQPVSLTDIITSTSVKKVYRKATLCIHPDKIQQRGASLEQKYTAEKVFDILKEAWKKFNVEELS